MHACAHTNAHTRAHKCTHTRTQTHTHTLFRCYITHTHTHEQPHARTPPRPPHTRTLTQTQTHTHTQHYNFPDAVGMESLVYGPRQCGATATPMFGALFVVKTKTRWPDAFQRWPNKFTLRRRDFCMQTHTVSMPRRWCRSEETMRLGWTWSVKCCHPRRKELRLCYIVGRAADTKFIIRRKKHRGNYRQHKRIPGKRFSQGPYTDLEKATFTVSVSSLQ